LLILKPDIPYYHNEFALDSRSGVFTKASAFTFRRLVMRINLPVLDCSSSSAQGIVAEIPQKSHGRFRGSGADSPVFCGYAAKNAPVTDF
jgi:hypothetical protein